METMDKRKKNRIIKNIVFNVIVLIVCVGYIVSFIVPKYTEIGGTTEAINNTMQKSTSLEKDGVDSGSFAELLNKFGRKKEIPENVFSDGEKLSKALAKPATTQGDYLSWLVEENGKINLLDKEIQKNDRILGNIIPIFINSPTIDIENDIDNQITLTSFISYVEKDILARYSLTSYVPLGISNISFSEKKDTPVNIGSFKIALDFKGKNSNILALVDALQKSGKLTISNGKIVSDNSSDNTPSKGQ